MDHEDGAVRVDYEHDLKHSAVAGRSPDQKLLIILDQRVRVPSACDDFLGFLRLDAMPSDMFYVPSIPSKIHAASRRD
jgi:hypothetical protein